MGGPWGRTSPASAIASPDRLDSGIPQRPRRHIRWILARPTFHMASHTSSGNTTQRLIRELKAYHSTPNEALLHLGPVDEDLLRWEAVLKGVNGTPYEGELTLTDTV